MMSIYLAYAEEESCTYDHIWTIEFSDLRGCGIGRRIDLIDFSPNCEEFISYMNTGQICLWSIKNKSYIRTVHTLDRKSQCPLTFLRCYNNSQNCIAFSKPNNLLMMIDFEGD